MIQTDDSIDNFSVHIVAASCDTLQRALDLVILGQEHKVVGYSIDFFKGFTLFCGETPAATPFPYPMNSSSLASFVFGWLEAVESQGRANWSHCAGPDNSSDDILYECGWELTTDTAADWRGICTIKPAWVLVGK